MPSAGTQKIPSNFYNEIHIFRYQLIEKLYNKFDVFYIFFKNNHFKFVPIFLNIFENLRFFVTKTNISIILTKFNLQKNIYSQFHIPFSHIQVASTQTIFWYLEWWDCNSYIYSRVNLKKKYYRITLLFFVVIININYRKSRRENKIQIRGKEALIGYSTTVKSLSHPRMIVTLYQTMDMFWMGPLYSKRVLLVQRIGLYLISTLFVQLWNLFVFNTTSVLVEDILTLRNKWALARFFRRLAKRPASLNVKICMGQTSEKLVHHNSFVVGWKVKNMTKSTNDR